VQDHGDGLLMEAAFISGNDGVEPLLVLGRAGQDDFDPLRRLAGDGASAAVAPLAGGIADGQAIGKARCDFAGDKARKAAFADAESTSDVAPEQQFGDLPGLLCAVTGYGLRRHLGCGLRSGRCLCAQIELRRDDE